MRRAVVVLVTALGFLAPLGAAGAAQAAPAQPASPAASVGKAWHPQTEHKPASASQLGQFSAVPARQAAEMAAVAQARATGKPVVVGSETTGTQLVTAEPDGTLVAATNILPVRVPAKSGWVAVDTRLRLAGGRLAATAVPGDSVSFSAGGTAAAARITEAGASLSLSWPGRLPAPSVSGSSATYANVLPGVNLVLTAVNGNSGGFREVLEVTSRQAAQDKGLASLAWRVSAPGTTGLRELPGGALLAQGIRARGFAAPAPVMWDSSTLPLRASPTAIRAAQASARAAGAGLAAQGMGAVSSAFTPATGAWEAAVGTRVTRAVLSLVPDARLLASPTTRFPVFIDPAFSPYDNTSGTQAYDTVQSDNGNEGCNTYFGGCDTGTNCTGPHYSTSINSTGDTPVGFDNFGAGGNCQVNDTDYALYQVGIPSGSKASNAHVLDASFQIREGYSSDCTSTAEMTATWIGGIGRKTGWPGPGKTSGDENATTRLGPDQYKNSSGATVSSCNNVQVSNNGATVAAGFNVTTDLQKLSADAPDITFRVWEQASGNAADRDIPSQPSTVLHKQLTINPTLEVHWIYSPSTPSDLQEASNNIGASSLNCDTGSSSPPRIGKTIAQGGVYLLADLTEPTTGGQNPPGLGYNVRYATGTSASPRWTTVKDVQTGSNGLDTSYKLPTSVTSGSGVTDGTIIQWEAQADIGTPSNANYGTTDYTSGWTKPCFFAVYPSAPDAPTLKANFTQTTPQLVGHTVTFTITQSSGDTASEFVWGEDGLPPTTSPPAARTCTTSAAESDSRLGASCTKIASGSATLTITILAPGPHDIWVYEVDSAGNDSGMTNGAPQGQSNTFDGAGDPADPYTSTAPGSTLQSNFLAALNAGKGYDNTMISKAPGTPAGASADAISGGNSFDEQDLKNAGWNPGQTVTVDGTTFTLPSFGTSSSGPDNLLAANQVIGTGANGARGTSLVFLATSTHASVTIPGSSGSGASDSGVLSGDVTAPMTVAGVGVTGSGCALDATFGNNAGCTPATGTINYSGTCSADGGTITQTSYTLTVPDWVVGPSDIAAVVLPHRDQTVGQQADNPSIYVYSVPIPGSCTVASVQLPDVAPNAFSPALHILGMAIRNTTTATPQVGGAMPASPSQQGWTGAFAAATDNAFAPPSGKTWGSQTIRTAVSPGVSAAAGADVRIRLSDPGWLSEDGSGPLHIGAASIAAQSAVGSPGAAAAPTALKFNGSALVTIPEGGDVYSDPIPLPFGVAPGTGILVSLYLTNQSLSVLPLNNNSSGAETWFAPPSTPDETGVQAGTPFTGSGGYVTATVPVLAGVDVTTPEQVLANPVSGVSVTYPSEPTVMVTGDAGIIDGELNPVPSDAANDPSQRLAGQLISQGQAPGFGVVDTSVEDNMTLFDAVYPDLGTPPNGLVLQSRIDHDVLAEPDLGTVLVKIGLEDMLWEDGTSSGEQSVVEDTLPVIARQLGAFVGGGGTGVILATQTPCSGYANINAPNTCDQYVEAGRVDINDKISTWTAFAGEADFSKAVSRQGTGTDPISNPGVLVIADDAGDHVNLTLGSSGGYAVLAPWTTLSAGFYPPANPLPPTP